MKNQPWFYEGIAVAFSRQKSCLSRNEFVARARTEPLLPTFEGQSPDMRFNYHARLEQSFGVAFPNAIQEFETAVREGKAPQ